MPFAEVDSEVHGPLWTSLWRVRRPSRRAVADVLGTARAAAGGRLMRVDADYVLPIKWHRDDGLEDLTNYLRWLSKRMRVIVVDGSDAALYARHSDAWGTFAVHLMPDPRWSFLNGKVSGVHTGVAHCLSEMIVIADDDVRYTDRALCQVLHRLRQSDLVVPQNVFDPVPWHARWDTARSLINRATAGDYAGTVAIRRDRFLAMGGYDGDVLFENLELMRTVAAHGGRVTAAMDVFVDRRPPTARHFMSQRVRQAYDSSAQPGRMAVELALLPLMITTIARRRSWAWFWAAMPALLCEYGRRRHGAADRIPAGAVLLGPAWVAERAVCAWLALGMRGRGVAYAGSRVTKSAHSVRWLRRHRFGGPAPR
jgi:hypothetical protein